MFKKRLAGKKRQFKQSELGQQEGGGEEKEEKEEGDQSDEVPFKTPVVTFKKRRIADKLNSVSTKV